MRTSPRSTAPLFAIGFLLVQAACASEELIRLPAVEVNAPAPASEAERIQAHLEVVLSELRAADASHLSAAQRANRESHIETLARYRDTGLFPLNAVDPERPVPVFRDEAGTWCAMGYLIASSGAEGVAERISRTRNTAFVWELVDDPEVVAWLEENGISAEEAGRVQPTYGPCAGCYYPPQLHTGVSAEYAAIGVLSAALSGGGIAVNLPGVAEMRSPAWRGSYGLLAGALSLGVGAAGVGDGGASTAIGATNIGLGAASAALGLRTLLMRNGDATAARSWRVYPVTGLDDEGAGRTGMGVEVRL